MPERFGQARHDGEVAIGALAERIGGIRASLDDLQTPFAASNVSIDTMGTQVVLLRGIATQFSTGLADSLPATTRELGELDAGAKGLVVQLEALRGLLGASADETRLIGASVDATRAQLAALLDGDAHRASEGMDVLSAATGRLGEAIAANSSASATNRLTVEGDLESLAARLAATHDIGASRLDDLSTRVGEVHGSIDALRTPYAASTESIEAMGVQVDGLGRAATQLETALASSLPGTVHGLSELEAGAIALAGRFEALHESLAAGAEGTRLIGSSVDAKRFQLAAMIESDTRRAGEGLDTLTAATGRLGEAISANTVSSAANRVAVEGNLTALAAQLVAASTDGASHLDGLSARVGSVHLGLTGLQTPFMASNEAVDAMAAQVEALRQAAAQLTAGLADSLPSTARELGELDAGATALTGRIAALRETLAAGAEETRLIGTSVDATRIQLAALIDGDTRRAGEELDGLAAAAGRLGEKFGANTLSSAANHVAVEGDLEALATRLAAAHETGGTRLDELAGQIGGVHASIGELSRPIGDAGNALGDMEALLDRLVAIATGLSEGINTGLTDSAAALGGFSGEAEGLLARTGLLHASIIEGAAALGGASEGLHQQRGQLVDATALLAGHFSEARIVLDRLRAEADSAATDAAEHLAPSFERARLLAQEGAEAMSEMLGKVVSDAEMALDRVGSNSVEASSGAPIRIHIAAIEAASDRAANAAEAAAQRVAGQTRALTSSIEGVEAKVAEMETKLDVRARDTLSARSGRLIEMLGESSVDVARLLAIDAGDKAWLRYLKGDRSIFARRAVKLIDRDTLAKITRHYAHDPAFNEEASRYLDVFETLTRRLLTDPDGEALTATMVSSDLGKLYVAIARATARLVPGAWCLLPESSANDQPPNAKGNPIGFPSTRLRGEDYSAAI